jgi:hypothetical protein
MVFSHFQNLYKELERENITKILKLTSNFPSFVSDEAYDLLREEASENEIKVVFHLFKRKKLQVSKDRWLNSSLVFII